MYVGSDEVGEEPAEKRHEDHRNQHPGLCEENAQVHGRRDSFLVLR
jgi:hypothetical protein